MAGARSPRHGLGGLGALFFLGTLGGIAFYVQRQTVEEQQDAVRRAVTMLPEDTEETRTPTMPWEDRLDLGAIALSRVHTPALPTVAEGADPTVAAADPAAPAPTREAAQEPAAVRPEDGLYVQELNDGHRILLTLDPVLQEGALQIFSNREVPYAGAVIVDLRDNAVLALAGHSSADPEVDPLEIVTTAWGPAASTFKLVTATALLETGSATPTSKACFFGGLHGIEDNELRDDPSVDTQCETLSAAVAHSYNLVIGKLALKHLGQDQLARTARALQFEADIPFEFNIERSPAHIPSEPIERAKVAAGFWNVDMSPMHGALLASIYARNGIYQAPHVIAQVVAPDGSDLTPARPKADRVIAADVAEAVALMMRDTTTQGTARAGFRDGNGNDYIPGVVVAGKTGSLTGKRPPAYNYNWFIGFAPADRPEVAFAVLLANEPKWRIKAHYAARRLVQIYLERREAIARNRDARLTPEGVMLPRRGPTGALVSATAKPEEVAVEAIEGLPPPPTGSDDDPGLPLPPVPGAIPTADGV